MKRTESGLQIVFGVFLGLMVTAFVGIGVNTFYPSPELEIQANRQTLAHQRESIGTTPNKPDYEQPPKVQAALKKLRDEEFKFEEHAQQLRRVWTRNTSIILIMFATCTMALALVRRIRVPVLSTGLLLGGVFTMLYGVVWIVEAETSKTRFGVITVAFVITVVLGFLRFRQTQQSVSESAAAVPMSEAWLPFDQRLTNLERRLDEASVALRRDD